ncbi:MAG: glycoside hydrolase family 10 protein [Rubricoccaceae bacterium]
MRSLLFPLALLLALGSTAAAAQTGPPPLPKHEFRGTWISTVLNLDWPDSRFATPAQQQQQLRIMLDRLKEAGINAVLLQVRPEADALYASSIEPWSYWLTGTQGQAPSPFWDPLQFAIEEAHARGMELHAWLNPYRADRGTGYVHAPNHVTQQHPEWILSFGNIRILDPGLPAVRDRIAAVAADIARRYAIDGLHFDDYFYPYPPNTISNEDDATFAVHHRGFTNRADWRRDNVNLMVAQVQDSLNAVRPEVKFGISPFGIWRSGTPSGTSGMDAYSVIYADARAWLDARTIDYVTPQLYWSGERTVLNSSGQPVFNQQRYTTLAAWWNSVRGDRHFYPGHGLYRADAATFSGVLFIPQDVPRQVRFNRRNDGIDGSVFFRAKNLTHFPSQGFRDSLVTDLYRHPAIPPPMAWKSQAAPGAPTGLTASGGTAPSEPVVLVWAAPETGEAPVRFYAVYRVPSAEAGDLAAAMARPSNLAAVVGQTTFTDRPARGDTYTYVVTALSHNSIESAPSAPVQVVFGTSGEPGAEALAFGLAPNRPNPFGEGTTLAFALDRPARVTLRVLDVLGREVARLHDEAPLGAGAHEAFWAADGLAAGTYLVVLEADGRRAARAVLRTR